MSTSPFISDDSIWSCNAGLPQPPPRSQSPRMSGAMAPNPLLASAPQRSLTAESKESTRIGPHPLPNRPPQPQRSGSSQSNRTAASEDRSNDTPNSKHGAIGAHRSASRGTQPPPKLEINNGLGRVNSLATSIHTFRSANSASPSFLHNSATEPLSAGRHLFQRQGSTSGVTSGSPSLAQNGAFSSVHQSRDESASGDTEFGTPRLFLEGQNAFPDNDNIPPLAGGASLSRSASASSQGGRHRPSSWMQPQSADSPGMYNGGDRRLSQAARSENAADFANGGISPHAGGRGPEASNGYPFHAPSLSIPQPVDGQISQGGDNIVSSPIDGSDILNAQNLPQTRNNMPRGGGSPSFGSSPFRAPSGRGTPTLNLPPNFNLAGGLLSPTAVTVGSMSPNPMLSPMRSPNLPSGGFPQRSATLPVSPGTPGFGSPVTTLDEQLQASPFLNDVLDRLVRVELGMKDFAKQVSGISRNVSLLLERTKGLPPASLAGGNAGAAPVSGAGASQDEMRALSAQINALTSSVSHLLTLQSGSAAVAANQTSQLVSNAMFGMPQLGGPGGERAISPRVGTGPNGQFGGQQSSMMMGHGLDNARGLSPRPGAGGRSWSGGQAKEMNDRRWSNVPPNAMRRDSAGLGPGTSNMDEGPGSMQGAGSSAIVTKWEHLNLNQDLLSSILKYGLGPPNKIQQRALPFLLRGSDIIAQAPPTQERIASYVIPVLQIVLNAGRENVAGGMGAGGRLNMPNTSAGLPPPTKGPVALIISTTVDQATQAQRMALGLGSALGIRVHMAAAGSIDIHQEAHSLVQAWPHIVVGTPQKMSELFTYLTNNAASMGNPPVSTSEVRLVVLDEVDQMIARNLADHVSSMLRVLPQPVVPPKGMMSPGLPANAGGIFTPLESEGGSLDRQVALFSNTVPQDVLNFAQSIHLRESVRVLVRRDGGAPSTTTPGNNPMPSPRRDNGPPSNALGAHPMNSNSTSLNDPSVAALMGMRQYYLYVAVTLHGGASPNPAANDMKLDLITDLLEDMEFGQSVIYCANPATQEAIVYKLASKGIEALGLNRDMNSYTRQQTLARFRSPTSQFGTSVVGTCTFAPPNGFAGVSSGQRARKALVVCDIAINPKDVHQVPLVLFYDMPRSVEEYKEKIACAASGAMARPSVCVNVVTASGGPRGDVEMLRTLECHLGCKMAELPMDPKTILN